MIGGKNPDDCFAITNEHNTLLRPRERYEQFLRRPMRYPLHLRNAAYRKKHDLTRQAIEPSRDQRMAELMRHNARKHQHTKAS